MAGGYEDRFVSLKWLQGLPFAVLSLWVASLGGMPYLNVGPGVFVFLGVAAFLMSLANWYLSRHPRTNGRKSVHRGLAIVVLGMALVSPVALGYLDQVVTTVLTAGIGVLIAVALWPTTKRLSRINRDDRGPYESESFAFALSFGLLALVTGCLIALFTSATGIGGLSLIGATMVYLGLSTLIDAWDQRRRLWWERKESAHHSPNHE
jgi:hypothetical protein